MKVELLAITPNSEKVIESAGRTCYMSFDKVKEGSAEKFISSIVKNGHTSVLEHAYATFRLRGVSRSFTHQLVRHRLCAFSQESQRYVDSKNFTYTIPPSIEKNEEAKKLYDDFMEYTKNSYIRLQKLNIVKEDIRFILPNGVNTEIVFSANFRELRHILKIRGSKRAQWEIREACIKILEILKEKAPGVFSDCSIDEKDRTITVGGYD